MSLGALTDVFTPSSSCLASTNIWEIRSENLYHQFGPPITSDCLPSNYTPAPTSFYSPGRCPLGYTDAVEYTEGSETIQTCCPSVDGFTFRTAGTSMADATTSNANFNWFSTFHCKHTVVTEGTIKVTVSESGLVSESTVTTGLGWSFGAYGVVVKFQETDFPESVSKSTETSASTTPTTGSQASSTPAPQSTPTSSPPSSTPGGSSAPSGGNMSTGTKAGIGAGVAAGVLAIALALAVGYIIGQRKSKRKAIKENNTNSQYQGSHQQEMRQGWSDTPQSAVVEPAGLPSTHVPEMYAKGVGSMPEMEGSAAK